ncbi:MAG: amino acid ABC transporter permease [Anaerolineae bacterium]
MSNFVNPLHSDQFSEDRPNPQKRNILIQRLSRAPWWLLVILSIVLIFIITVQDSRTYQNAWAEVRTGIWTTVWVTVVAYAMALVLGLIFTLLRRPSKSLWYNMLVYQPTTVIVEFVRGIPTLVFVLYITLAIIPQVVIPGLNSLGVWLLENNVTFGNGLAELTPRDFPNVWRAIIALAISYSAFLSEIFRAGIESISLGQREAAASLGMNGFQTMRYIILPQAIRNILPPLGNDFIAMLKESSLVSVVGVSDITREGQTYAAGAFAMLPTYTLVAFTYLVLTLTLSLLVKGLETWLGRGRDRS